MASVTETVQLAARVPVDLAERLAAVAKADDRTVSYAIRQAIREFVEDREDWDDPTPIRRAS